MNLLQAGQRNALPQRATGLDGDPADPQQPIDLGPGKVVGGPVGSDAEFVQPAGFFARFKDHHAMAQHRQPMRTGQPRRPGPGHGDRFAGRRRALKRMPARGHQPIDGMALQAADFDRPALGYFAHTDLFARGFGRGYPRAHAAPDVLFKDRPRRAGRLPGLDLAEEQRDVDVGRAGPHTGRIMAEIASVRRHCSPVRGIGRVQVAEVFRALVVGKPPCGDP